MVLFCKSVSAIKIVQNGDPGRYQFAGIINLNSVCFFQLEYHILQILIAFSDVNKAFTLVLGYGLWSIFNNFFTANL